MEGLKEREPLSFLEIANCSFYMAKSKIRKFSKKIHLDRILLVALVAVSFFGFLLWYIDQAQIEETSGIDITKVARPLENKVIKIESPKVNAAATSPLTIEGQAAITGGALMARLKDMKGLILGESNISVKSSKKMVPFSLDLKYKKSSTAKGTVEIFRVADKDNSETYKLSIPVVFKN